MLELIDVSLSYKQDNQAGITVLRKVNLALPAGERLTVIGPSGCGKTTLLLVLSGLMAPTSGQVRLDGRPLTGPHPEIAVILQEYGLFPWKKVLDNASLGLVLRGSNPRQAKEQAALVLDTLGILDQANKYPLQLSGGQRQRVAIARALTLEPRYLFMDEPFSSLDALTRESLQETLLNLWQTHRFTMVMVTHSIEEAVFLGSNIVVFSGKPGGSLRIVDNQPTLPRSSDLFYHSCARVRSLLKGVQEN